MIKAVYITTRPGRDDGDPGACEVGHYKVENNFVVMCNADGRPTGKKQNLGPDDDAHSIAARLTREAWLRRARANDFNRRIDWPSSGVA
jgi:hypothetical protein